ncbi:hypothetical protein Cfor_09832 [Coptotermes formosanus]|uniref:Reverse transcriptase domain-containing protein n=1 Tax=Coptotermes formosanus TaxID=36987 RepID=A0A6L2Q791_COPFO|nr:hypothetical protein Cfor_09832 [Coptotermes formosanus]
MFPCKWTGRGELVTWPSRSLNITPYESFLWGYIADAVYFLPPPTTTPKLAGRLQAAAVRVTPAMLQMFRINSTRDKICVGILGVPSQNICTLRGRVTKHAFGMLKIMLERTSDTDEDVYVCFTNWHKALDRVNWNKLMQILKNTGTDWRRRNCTWI